MRAKQFTIGALSRRDLDDNPIRQFRTWYSHAQAHGVRDPQTVTLSTAHLPSGRVSARMVYLKEIENDNDNDKDDDDGRMAVAADIDPLAGGGQNHASKTNHELEMDQDPSKRRRTKQSRTGGGFIIYSNWATSHKSHDMRTNPHAALTFWWPELERQIRVEGQAERLTSEESQPYFDSRIRGSRIGAWASPQSQVLRPRGRLATSRASATDGE